MTTLIQNEQKRQKIMARMREHLVPVLEHCRGGWVGLFLQGSQNYNLDYEGSDIDTKAIMLPSFSDFVLNAKPLSTTHIMENNEHVDFKDIRTPSSTRSMPIFSSLFWTLVKRLPDTTTTPG